MRSGVSAYLVGNFLLKWIEHYFIKLGQMSLLFRNCLFHKIRLSCEKFKQFSKVLNLAQLDIE